MISGKFLYQPLPVLAWIERSAEDKREAVRDLIEVQGMTYGQAAVQLAASRVAIAGVVNRAKDIGQPIVSKSRVVNQHDREAKRLAHKKQPDDRPGDNIRAEAIVRRLADPPAERLYVDAWAPLPGSTPVSLEHCTDGCRWPLGESLPYSFCNLPAAEASPYCPAHTAMGTRPLNRNERKLAVAPRPKGAVAATAWE